MTARALTSVRDASRELRLLLELANVVSRAAVDRGNAKLQLALREAFPDRFCLPQLPRDADLISLAQHVLQRHGDTPLPRAARHVR